MGRKEDGKDGKKAMSAEMYYKAVFETMSELLEEFMGYYPIGEAVVVGGLVTSYDVDKDNFE